MFLRIALFFRNGDCIIIGHRKTLHVCEEFTERWSDCIALQRNGTVQINWETISFDAASFLIDVSGNPQVLYGMLRRFRASC
jgi:hypothetical protein